MPGFIQMSRISGLIAFAATHGCCGDLYASPGTSRMYLSVFEAMGPTPIPPMSRKHGFSSFTSASPPHPIIRTRRIDSCPRPVHALLAEFRCYDQEKTEERPELRRVACQLGNVAQRTLEVDLTVDDVRNILAELTDLTVDGQPET